MFRLLCAPVVALALLHTGAAASAGHLTIVPGRSLGKTYLGESRALVRERLGHPSYQTNDGANGLQSDTWFNRVTGIYYTEVCYHAGRVVQITTNNGKFRTPDGFSASSTLPEVRRRFPFLRHHTYHDPAHPSRAFTQYYDQKTGISFENMNGVSYFEAVTVFWTGHRPVAD